MSAELTLLEKVSLTSGGGTWHTTPARGLPALTLADGPHGLRRLTEGGDVLGFSGGEPATCFPPAVALAASWNPELAAKVGAALGVEARSLGVHVLLGPGMNIKRSPLCGRNFEYFSEDPHLTGRLSAALVRGIQSQGVAATVKHFAANNQETDRMRVSAEVSERALREIYLRAFEHVVVTARPWALMTAYNRLNGRYASEDPWLLTQILREEWGFDGLVMSDWGAVNDRVGALRAGLDLEMPPSRTDEQVVAAVASGELDEALVDRAATSLQRLAARVLPAAQGAPYDVEAHDALASAAAAECLVLLKNDKQVLPLTDVATLAVIGPFATTPRFQGGGSSRVTPTAVRDPLTELRRAAGQTTSITMCDGYRLDGEPDADLAATAVAAAERADAILLLLGLPEEWESEGFDREHLDLPQVQRDLTQALGRLDTPVVAVLSNGGVVSVGGWQDDVDALVEGWLLGQAGAAALADVLFGLASPSGRLAETIPLRLQDNPSYLHFPGRDGLVRYGEDVYVGYRYYETAQVPVAYPFGHGLTYGTFEYGDLTCEPCGTNAWRITLRLTNTGARAAAETVQLYVGVDQALPTRPSRELRGFTKVPLEPGGSCLVTFELQERDLAVWSSAERGWHVPAGEYQVLIGASVRDIRLSATIGSAGSGHRQPLTEDSLLGEWLAEPTGRAALEPFLARVRAALGAGADEVLSMARYLPLRKVIDFDKALTRDEVDAFVAHAARLRAVRP